MQLSPSPYRVMRGCIYGLLVATGMCGCRGKDAASDNSQPAGGSTSASTGAGVEAPVPVFLADPGTALNASGSAITNQVLALPSPTPTPPVPIGDAGTASQTQYSSSALLSSLLADVDLAITEIISGCFAGQGAALGSAAVADFDVSAHTFPATVPVHYLRLTALTGSPFGYEAQGFCEGGASGYFECLRIQFGTAPPAVAGPVQLLVQTPDRTSKTANAFWILSMNYTKDGPVSVAIHHSPPLSGALAVAGGILTAPPTAAGTLVTTLTLAEAAGSLPLLFPALPRSRDDSSRREVGDLFVSQSLRPAAGTELALRNAFVPVAERAAGVSLAPGVFTTDSLAVFGASELTTLVRNPKIDKGCQTAGQSVRAAASPAGAAAVSSLPDDLCADDTALTDAVLLTSLEDVCGGGGQAVLNLTLSAAAAAPAIAYDVCDYYRSHVARLSNPGLFSGLAFATQVLAPAAPSPVLDELASALLADTEAMSLDQVLGLSGLTFATSPASAFAGAPLPPH